MPRAVICLKSHKEPGFRLGLGLKNCRGGGEGGVTVFLLFWLESFVLNTYILELVYRGSQEHEFPEDKLSPQFTATLLVMGTQP